MPNMETVGPKSHALSLLTVPTVAAPITGMNHESYSVDVVLLWPLVQINHM